MAEDTMEASINLHGSMDPALLPDITTSYEHLQRNDGTVGSPALDKTLTPNRGRCSVLVEKASSGRMSPIRKKSVKDVEKQIEALEKENFDLKLRIYFLEQQKGINRDDTLKVNIDLKVQLQSIHQEFQTKQTQWEQMMSSYEEHINELEKEIHKHKASSSNKDVLLLKEQLSEARHNLQDMEQQLRDKAIESETHLQALSQELNKLKQQLSEKEHQSRASPPHEGISQLKKSLEARDGIIADKDEQLLKLNEQVDDLQYKLQSISIKLSGYEAKLGEKDEELMEKESEMAGRSAELTSMKVLLSQKEAALLSAQKTLQLLQASVSGQEAELEKYKNETLEKVSRDNQSLLQRLGTSQELLAQRDAVLLSRDKELSAQRRDIQTRDDVIQNLNDELNKYKKEQFKRDDILEQLKESLREKQDQYSNLVQSAKNAEEKFSKDLSNVQYQVKLLEAEVVNKNVEISSLKKNAVIGKSLQAENMEQIRDALSDKDKTIKSLMDTVQQKDEVIHHLQSRNVTPLQTSSPRDESDGLAQMCMQIELLKKENAALREGRTLEQDDEDDLHLSCASDTSETRDYLHAQLAKYNAKAAAIQTKLLSLSADDVDAAVSESSSILKEQVNALMRLRQADKKVIEALQKHISVNSDGKFNPEVISQLAADVNRLSEKIKELHKKGGSTGSRSARSNDSSSRSTIYKEENNHLRKELDEARLEASKVKAEYQKLHQESALFSKLEATEALVRLQSDEKKQLLEQLVLLKNKLRSMESSKTDGIRGDRFGSLDNLSSLQQASRIPRRASSTPRLNSSWEGKKSRDWPFNSSYNQEEAAEGDLRDRLAGIAFRKRHLTPDKINATMKQFASDLASQVPAGHGTGGEEKGSGSAENLVQENKRLHQFIEQYRNEVQLHGRPAELKKQIDDLLNRLQITQDKLDKTLEHAHEIELSYRQDLQQKDEYIEELERKIQILTSRLSDFEAGRLSTSISIPLSRPGSSLASVPLDRSGPIVVSLNGKLNSPSGSEKSVLSFKASPVQTQYADNAKGADKRADSDDAGTFIGTALSSKLHDNGRSLSPLLEVTSTRTNTSTAKKPAGSSGSSASSTISATTKSSGNIFDFLDSTTEKMRKDSVSMHTDVDLGSLVGDPLPTQEDLLNISSDTAKSIKQSQQQHSYSRRLFTETSTSPEKGRLLSPVPNLITERYEKVTSPNKTVIDRSKVSSMSATQTSTQTDPLDDVKELTGRLVQALNKEDHLKSSRQYQAELYKQYEQNLKLLQEENRDLRERISECEADVEAHMRKRLETAEIANDLQKTIMQRNGVIDQLNKQVMQAQSDMSQVKDELKAANQQLAETSNQNQEILLQLKEAKMKLADQDGKLKDEATKINNLTAKLAKSTSDVNSLQKDLESANKRLAELNQHNKDLTQQLRDLQTKVSDKEMQISQLNKSIAQSQNNSNKKDSELQQMFSELNAANQRTIEVSKQYREAAAHLREVTGKLKEHEQKNEHDVQTEKAELKRLLYQLKAMEDDRNSIKSQLKAADDDRVTIKNQLKTAEDDRNSIKHQLKTAEDDRNSLKHQLQSVKEELVIKATREEELGYELEKNREEKEQLINENNELKAQTIALGKLQTDLRAVATSGATRRQESDTNVISDTPNSRGSNKQMGVRRLRDEINSLLDTSAHIKANIISALEQSQLNDSELGDNTAQQQDSNLINLLKLNLTRVEELNDRISELIEFEQELLRADSSNNSDLKAKLSVKKLSSSSQPGLHNVTDSVSQAARQSQSLPVSFVMHDSSRQPYLNRSQNNAEQSPERSSSVDSTRGRNDVRENIPELRGFYDVQTNGGLNRPSSPTKGTLQSSNDSSAGLSTSSPTSRPFPLHSTAISSNKISPSFSYGNDAEQGQTRLSPVRESHSITLTDLYDDKRDEKQLSGEKVLSQPNRVKFIDGQGHAELPVYDLPSTRGPLYAVSELINYELLKKQNEECLLLMSGLEARVQSRLDRFTTSSPLENAEWCTLKELKNICINMRQSLFSEKKHILKFYIKELPEVRAQKYEDLLRSYKRMESRYNWAKTQLMELMRVTKQDEDLISQMKRVKCILQASKENIKSKLYNPEKLKPKQATK